MQTIPLVPFYYIRHGETDWNKQDRIMGQTDIPLNANGIAQAILGRDRLTGYKIKAVCHSPLLRAKHTAELLNQALAVPLIEIESLREFNLGRVVN